MKMRLILFLFVLPILCLAACASTSRAGDPKAAFGAERAEQVNLRGWDFLVNRLRKDGIDPGMLRSVYASTRMPLNEKVSFSLNPKESHQIYKRFSEAQRIARAKEYLKRFASTFSYAQKSFGVNPYVIAAILLTETDLGRVTGKELIVWRLSRLATICDPENIAWNYKRLFKDDPSVKLEDLKTRAAYLDALFYPELEALFDFAAKTDTDVFQLRGSVAGAFGIPQFLPSSYRKYALDGNADNVVSLFRDEDAIVSVANYLAKSGWDEAPRATDSRRRAIWSYNRSNAYVDAVLKVAALIKAPIPVKSPLKTINKRRAK